MYEQLQSSTTNRPGARKRFCWYVAVRSTRSYQALGGWVGFNSRACDVQGLPPHLKGFVICNPESNNYQQHSQRQKRTSRPPSAKCTCPRITVSAYCPPTRVRSWPNGSLIVVYGDLPEVTDPWGAWIVPPSHAESLDRSLGA